MKIALKVLVAGVLLFSCYKPSYTNNILSVHYLDIGQGDATLVRTPEGKNILIDAGYGKEAIYQLSEVLPVQDRKIDIVIVTHNDFDHIGGLIEVLERYEIGVVITSNKVGHSAYAKLMYEIINEQGIDLYAVNSESDFLMGCCINIDFLWPIPDIDLSSLSENDKSISFVISYGDIDFLFDGDLSFEYEELMVGESELDIEVLQVGHHGSKTSTSSEFLEHIHADVGIISAGKDNKFGHPHQEVIDNLMMNTVKVLRTDELGTITISSDSISYWFD